MKFMKRKKIYQASNYNCTFNPETCEAYSYDWWKFVARINGKTVFNSYYYSPSTRKHQGKVRGLLRSLGIAIDVEMQLPRGINSTSMKQLKKDQAEFFAMRDARLERKRIERNRLAREKRAAAKLAKLHAAGLRTVASNAEPVVSMSFSAPRLTLVSSN